uniref:Probable imidazolonepropionase n=1 Tax=Globisporangium ultimum (strain ATCC 200006 / CBS 805.95 / DAOM BR144) TaxID=431595 RepID=K3WGI1_GLOUD
MSSFRLRISNARQIVQVCANHEKFKAGKAQDELAVIAHGALVVDHVGKIAAVGTDEHVAQWLQTQPQPVHFDEEIDGSEFCILPGFVDGHTHPVWSGNRVGEFAMKLAGATYMEVHESGGGINCSVRATRNSSEEELTQLLTARLDRMLRSGTTLIEAKSGYGLETATELKMLRVLHNAKHPVEIVSNYLGGHSVPEGMTAAAATDDIVNNQIPAVVQAIKDGTISPEFIDVFCEKGVFEHDDTRRILEAGAKAGLKINFHGDEMCAMQSGTLASDLHARAVSHCEMLTAKDLEAMASHTPDPVFAVLLPTTKYILKLPSPPARDMLTAGVPIALGSDFNPNAHCMSMAMTMNMACVLFGMTMKEALVGATINAAASIDRSATHGSIEVGKQADLVILHATQWEQVIYEMVDPPIEFVVKKGVFYPSNK